MTEIPFYDKIKIYAENTPARFHVPGHKGRLDGIFENVSKYDVTELPQTGNLYDPDESLLQAEEAAAKLFGFKKIVFSAGGATFGNQTILSFFFGEKVIFDRNIHISAFNAAVLLDIKPVFIYNEYSESETPLPVSPAAVSEAFEKNPDAKALFITSPNYYGNCADCAALREICVNRNASFLLDSAHGTHLHFFTPNNHADMAVLSAHKTLPALTGGAYICFNGDIERNEISARMMMFGSTSPSFLILSSLDGARAWCESENNMRKFVETASRLGKIKTKLNNMGALFLHGENNDPLRLCLTLHDTENAYKTMSEQGVIPEMCDGKNIVFLFSPFNTENDFRRFENVLNTIDLSPPPKIKQPPFPATRFVCSPKEVIFAKCEKISTKKSLGKIAARTVVPYPPGVPLLLPGELITDEIAAFLENAKINEVYAV